MQIKAVKRLFFQTKIRYVQKTVKSHHVLLLHQQEIITKCMSFFKLKLSDPDLPSQHSACIVRQRHAKCTCSFISPSLDGTNIEVFSASMASITSITLDFMFQKLYIVNVIL